MPKHLCKGCETVKYCCSECQRIHWPTHKKWCKTIKKVLIMEAEQPGVAFTKLFHTKQSNVYRSILQLREIQFLQRSDADKYSPSFKVPEIDPSPEAVKKSHKLREKGTAALRK